ncbi:MAG: ABC transporter permease [Leucobacter sp.]
MTTKLSPNSGLKQLGAAQASWLVAEREITTRLRSKAFLISTGVLLFLTLAGVLFGGIMAKTGGFGGGDEPVKVAVVGEAGAVAEQAGFELDPVADRAAAEELVRSGDVEAAIVPGGDGPLGITVIVAEVDATSVVQALTVSPDVEILAAEDPDAGNPFLAYIIAIAFGIVFMMSAVTFGTTIAQSVVEEKQTRIVEILLATVSARTMLAGKILGNSILALAQVVAIAALAAVGMLVTGQDLLLGELGTALIWFAVLFAFGFVLLATLYATLAALVSRQEDIGSVTSPVMMLVMLPYIAIILFNDNPLALSIMSYIPFSAPVGMPMRLYLGTAEWWEPILSLGILAVSIALVLGLAARIYEGSILRTGARVKIREALKA